jgi:hypothetical protein
MGHHSGSIGGIGASDKARLSRYCRAGDLMLSALRAGQSQVITNMGDSTGVYESASVKRGFYRVTEQLAKAAGAGVRVEFSQWSDANQRYNPPVIVQPGTAGERHLLCDGASTGRGFQVNAETAPNNSLSEDLEIELRFTPNAAIPATRQMIFSHDTANGWYIDHNVDGNLRFTFKDENQSFRQLVVTPAQANLSTTGVNHLKFVFRRNNGSGVCGAIAQKSDDNGASWTTIATYTGGALVGLNKPVAAYQMRPPTVRASPSAVASTRRRFATGSMARC